MSKIISKCYELVRCDGLAFARRSTDTCLIIGLRPLACGLGTPLSIDAPAPRGPQTPWSSERTPVRPPGRNPEEEPMLAGATGRRGARGLIESHTWFVELCHFQLS